MVRIPTNRLIIRLNINFILQQKSQRIERGHHGRSKEVKGSENEQPVQDTLCHALNPQMHCMVDFKRNPSTLRMTAN